MNKKIKQLAITILLSSLLLVLLTQIANAAGISSDFRPANEPFDLGDIYKENDGAGGAVTILQILAGGLLYFAAPVAVIMMIKGGFDMVTGGAESEKLEQAKKHLTWTALGLLLIIFSYSAVRIAIFFIIRAASVAA